MTTQRISRESISNKISITLAFSALFKQIVHPVQPEPALHPQTFEHNEQWVTFYMTFFQKTSRIHVRQAGFEVNTTA